MTYAGMVHFLELVGSGPELGDMGLPQAIMAHSVCRNHPEVVLAIVAPRSKTAMKL
jgi:hypothetical protein